MKNKKSGRLIARSFIFDLKSGREDSNLRPFGPEPNALPGCATPRQGNKLWKHSKCRARRCQTGRTVCWRHVPVSLLLRARVLEVTPDPPGRAREDDDADEEVEAVEPGLERLVLVPLLAEHLADVGEAEAPRQRAEEGVDG